MSKVYVAPTGSAIVGTAEKVCVCYPIYGIEDDGEPHYSGGEDTVYWDTAEQQKDKKGRLLYQDEDGCDWAFEDLILEEVYLETHDPSEAELRRGTYGKGEGNHDDEA